MWYFFLESSLSAGASSGDDKSNEIYSKLGSQLNRSSLKKNRKLF
jgi:hypothetical protein